uniref:Uncharacterized protein n=1 Tax=Anguilla anguilla TaxID=7936 RepID=A0A0E9R3S0_ANGAN
MVNHPSPPVEYRQGQEW